MFNAHYFRVFLIVFWLTVGWFVWFFSAALFAANANANFGAKLMIKGVVDNFPIMVTAFLFLGEFCFHFVSDFARRLALLPAPSD